MKNLETKVKVGDHSQVLRNIIFAEYIGVLKQKDTYYITGSAQLKIREEGDKGEMIFYFRPHINSSKYSRYLRVNLGLLLLSSKAFFNFLLGEKSIVTKDRILYIHKNTRIHLDTVPQFGNFVELETVFSAVITPSEASHEHEEVKKLLGIEKYNVISGSYSDLVLSK